MNSSPSSIPTTLENRWIVSKVLEKQESQAVHTKRVLKPRVNGSRINQRNEAQLAYAGPNAGIVGSR